jgi:hypothetical protein
MPWNRIVFPMNFLGQLVIIIAHFIPVFRMCEIFARIRPTNPFPKKRIQMRTKVYGFLTETFLFVSYTGKIPVPVLECKEIKKYISPCLKFISSKKIQRPRNLVIFVKFRNKKYFREIRNKYFVDHPLAVCLFCVVLVAIRLNMCLFFQLQDASKTTGRVYQRL